MRKSSGIAEGWLLVTDFDGTLVDHRSDPGAPDELVSWISRFRADGGIWAINTGRELPYLLQGIRMAKVPIVPDFAIVVEREIHRYDCGQYDPVLPWHRHCIDRHAEVFAQYADRWPALIQWIEDNAKATIYEDEYSPFSVIADSETEATRIHTEMDRQAQLMPGVLYVHNSIYGRFAHSDFHKGSALTELARVLEIPTSQIIVAGDHWNDVSMFDPDRARWWIAPSESIGEVRRRVSAHEYGYVSGAPCGHGLLDGLLRIPHLAGI